MQYTETIQGTYHTWVKCLIVLDSNHFLVWYIRTYELLSKSASPSFWVSWLSQLNNQSTINLAQKSIWIQNNYAFHQGLVITFLKNTTAVFYQGIKPVGCKPRSLLIVLHFWLFDWTG